jgi:DtxR family Mn-dependent transcriptional regulator
MSRSTKTSAQSRPTYTIEDYLMTMQVMERDYGEIVAARLAEMMNVAPATVTVTLQRMERDKWIAGKGRKGGIRLTDTGREAAHDVIRRHMLTEWLLVKIFKIPLPQIHDEAHGIEHAISPQLEDRMREVLDDPKVCPHGNPFPGCESIVAKWIALADLAVGDQGTVRRIHEFAEDNPDLLKFLYEHQIIPGTQIQVTEILPFNHTVTVLAAGKHVTLGASTAQFLFLEKRKK